MELTIQQEKIIGLPRTPGAPAGEMRDTSKSKETPKMVAKEHAVSTNMLYTLKFELSLQEA